MICRNSEILWGNRQCEELRAVMLAECKRATELGGTFEIEVIYTHTWVERYRIYYPETETK